MAEGGGAARCGGEPEVEVRPWRVGGRIVLDDAQYMQFLKLLAASLVSSGSVPPNCCEAQPSRL